MQTARRIGRLVLWWIGRLLFWSVLPAISFVVALTAATNLFINLALPTILNQRPERMQITWQFAWMLLPGDVHVRGLKIRTQSAVDQWEIAAPVAAGWIDIADLRYHRFRVAGLWARGATFSYRVRADSPPPAPPGDPGPGRDVSSAEPPIPGLLNPPMPRPEDIYPPPEHPWLIQLDDVSLAAEQLWISDYRFVGKALVRGNLLMEGPYLDATLSVALAETTVTRGRDVMATQLRGNVGLLLDGMDRETDRGDDTFRAVAARMELAANADDLSFIGFYLDSAPWLALDGSGRMNLDLGFRQGQLVPGSLVVADFPDLVVGFQSYAVCGTGRVVASVVTVDDVPESRLDVTFDDFGITSKDTPGVLVSGSGFAVHARSPDTGLDRPFSRVDAEFILPESQIVDIAPYNEFLPRDIGFSIQGGTGTLRGELFATSEGNAAHGDLWIAASEMRARYEHFDITGGVDLHARLAEARLDSGYYDMSGTTIDLRHMGFVGAQADGEGSHDWSAHFSMPSGVARVGTDDYLDARLTMTATNSDPLVAVLVDKKTLPKWVGEMLRVPNIHASMRLRLGLDYMKIAPAEVTGGNYQLRLQLRKRTKTLVGDLYARYGALSLGLGLHGGPAHVQVFGAKKWFEAQPPL